MRELTSDGPVDMPDEYPDVLDLPKRGSEWFTGEDTLPSTLPNTSAERKAIPVTSGVLDYFPAAIAEVAKVSKAGNDKHNPGEPMHHARGKSTDHADSIARHLMERGGFDPDTGVRHSAELAWRALALLQQELEDAGAPLARGAKLPEDGATLARGAKLSGADKSDQRAPRYKYHRPRREQ